MANRFYYGCIENSISDDHITKDIYGLRYQVYVNEWGFESPNDHPDGRDHDDYDEHSFHIYAYSKTDPDNLIIGTVRLILNSSLGFPIEKHFNVDRKPVDIDPKAIGEISRLAVSKEYRRRIIDRAIFGVEKSDMRHVPRYINEGKDPRRHCEHELVRGLYLAIYRKSKIRKLTHWYAVMAKSLHVLLNRWGLPFEQVGPAMDYHGLRAPYLASIASIEDSLERLNPELLKEAKSLTFH